MVHFILWLNLLCTSITRGIIGDIVGGGGGGIPGLGDLTKTVNGIVDKVNIVPEILDVVDEIEDFVQDIEDTANSVFSKVNDIFEDTAKLVKLLENPLKTIDPSDDIKDLANTLAVCMTDMTKLIPGADLFGDVLDFGEDILALFPIDPADIAIKALAAGLLSIKPLVEFVCFDILPSVISMLEDILDHVPSIEGGSRRRLWEYDDCTADDGAPEGFDGFCKPTAVQYPYDTSDGHKEMIRFLSDGGFTTNDAEGGNNAVKANILQRYRTAQQILGIMAALYDEVVDAVSDCSEIAFGEKVAIKCALATVAGPLQPLPIGLRPVKWVIHTFVGILDYAVESAEYHDGNILGTRVDAIFYDRETIIHNQLKLRDYLYEAAVDRQKKYDSLIGNLTALPNHNAVTGGNGNGNGGKANAEYGTLMDGVNEKTGDEGLTVINLRIQTGDLYVVVGFIIGFNAIFIGMTVALILNCCNGSNSGYHRVVKYETESEIEQK